MHIKQSGSDCIRATVPHNPLVAPLASSTSNFNEEANMQRHLSLLVSVPYKTSLLLTMVPYIFYMGNAFFLLWNFLKMFSREKNAHAVYLVRCNEPFFSFFSATVIFPKNYMPWQIHMGAKITSPGNSKWTIVFFSSSFMTEPISEHLPC